MLFLQYDKDSDKGGNPEISHKDKQRRQSDRAGQLLRHRDGSAHGCSRIQGLHEPLRNRLQSGVRCELHRPPGPLRPVPHGRVRGDGSRSREDMLLVAPHFFRPPHGGGIPRRCERRPAEGLSMVEGERQGDNHFRHGNGLETCRKRRSGFQLPETAFPRILARDAVGGPGRGRPEPHDHRSSRQGIHLHGEPHPPYGRRRASEYPEQVDAPTRPAGCAGSCGRQARSILPLLRDNAGRTPGLPLVRRRPGASDRESRRSDFRKIHRSHSSLSAPCAKQAFLRTAPLKKCLPCVIHWILRTGAKHSIVRE